MEQNTPKNRIMIVDDERDFVKLLEKRLALAGYSTSVAYTGEEAVKRAKEEMPDIILLDVMMPGMSGYEVRNSLKQDASTAGIAVIFLTAMSSIEDKIQGFEYGIDDYITKPFEHTELLLRISSILKRRQYYEEISMTDALTGLFNVHFFRKEFKILSAASKRYKYIFSLALIDIDGLKAINDTHGHIAGDEALKRIASVAKQVLRHADIIIRYGGDEFVFLMPGVDKKSALLAMKRLTNALAEIGKITTPKGDVVSVSISFGVAEFNDSIEDENEMIKIADSDMYSFKKLKSRAPETRSERAI